MSLATPSEPLHQDTSGAGEELVQTGRIPVHSVVIVVPTERAMQPRKHHPSPQLPVLCTPHREALQGVPELRARGAAFARLFARPILAPLQRKPEKLAPRWRCGGLATARQQPGLVPCQLQSAFPHALAQHGVESFGVLPMFACAPLIVRIAEQARFAVTVPFDHFLTPQIERIVQRDIGEERGNRAPWRASRRRMPHGAVGVEPPRFAPLREQPSPCTVSTALRPPPEEPLMVEVVARPNPFIPLSTTHRQTPRQQSRSPTPALRSSAAVWCGSRRARALPAWALSLSPPVTPGSCGCPRPPRMGSRHRPSLPPGLPFPRRPSPSAWLSPSHARCAVLPPTPTLASALPRVAHPSLRRPHGARPGGDRGTTPLSCPPNLGPARPSLTSGHPPPSRW